MDSINRNQPEQNRADLRGEQAVEKLHALLKGQTCFFCTTNSVGGIVSTRPMNIRDIDESGNLWFLSASDSHKNAELESSTTVQLYSQGSSNSDFVALRGRAEVRRDQQRIDALWSPVLKTWFTEGKDDPRITVIKVTPEEAYYWDTKHGEFVAGIKMLIGAALGVTLDDSIEGTLRV